jgi:sugar/nucleoside kinase (ribokinase family)
MREKKLDVTAIGCLAVDYFALVPSIPGPEEKIMAGTYEVHPGGVSGNVLTQTARLGLRSGWLGKIGDDEAGEILIKEFEKEGIDTSHTEVVENKHSMFTWIQVDKRGGRSITMFPNVLIELTADEIEEKHADYIVSSKAFQAESCILPFSPMIRAMEIAKENGVTVVFDLDVPPSYLIQESKQATQEQLRRAIEISDIFIPCKAGARELVGSGNIESNARKLFDLGPEIVAVTLGEKGCIVMDKKDTITVPGYRVDVRDTTGAGDAFHAGFIYGVLNGKSLEETGRFSNACGAICCENVGARAMGTLDEVVSFMEKYKKP